VNIRAVFFDFDGVLIDSMPAHERAWGKILSSIGIHLDSLYFRLHEGEKADDTVRTLLLEHGVILSEAEQRALIERKRQLYRTFSPKGLIPEARVLVNELRARGVECSIVTGSVRSNMNSVLAEDEFSLFERIISADNYLRGKPEPDPYLMALEQSGFHSGECLVLENAPLGIQSAKAAGLKTIAIAVTLPPEYLRQADEIIFQYQELLKFL
jgi:beta-phosphoglucomutase